MRTTTCRSRAPPRTACDTSSPPTRRTSTGAISTRSPSSASTASARTSATGPIASASASETPMPRLALSLLLVLCRAAPLLAHAVLTKTTLDGTPVRAGTPTTVTLSFNAAIEPGLSKVVLVNERREERVLEVVPRSEREAVTVTLPALTPGAYGLRYKVLAVDGHVTESVVRFKVAATE